MRIEKGKGRMLTSTVTHRRNSLLKDVRGLSSPPTVYTHLTEAMQNTRSSIVDIARIISNDQVLTARLLKLANSPVYGFPSKIETISEAISILGTQQICDLVLATSVMQRFHGIPRELTDMESFWCHSVSCGLAARILATYKREPNVERFFVAGVLHDIGRLIMYTALPRESSELLRRCREAGHLVYDLEEQLLGFEHGIVGSDLLKEWCLPDSLQEMVRFHHRPLCAGRFPVETAIVHVADIIAHAMELGSSSLPGVPLLETGAWERLELSPGVLADLTRQVDVQYHEAVKVIGVKAG